MRVLTALVLGAIVELYVMYLVANWVGFWSMLGLVILVSLAGFSVIRFAGLRTVRRFAAGEPPSTELADGAVFLTAGILIAVPGFVSGAFGALLLVPPVRALVRTQLARRTGAMAARFGVGGPGGPSGRGSGRSRVHTETIIATYERPRDTTARELPDHRSPHAED
jgi:UPF0716 protein FxsA